MTNNSREEHGSILLVQAVDYDRQSMVGFQPLCTPLSIATICGLTPSEFHVDMWDENLDGFIDEATVLPRSRYDIVGISTLFEQVGHRVPSLAALFRRRGTYTCAGGPGISNQLKMISACVDTVFLNEAEYTWPQFLREWLAGHPKKEYVQVAKPDLAESPPPRWEPMAERIPSYRAGGVQTTRGCPFDCEFCDVIYLYGRAQRHKPVEHVLSEVSALQRLGAKRIFFTDDEFIGNPRYSATLLRELVPLNNSFPEPLAYHTQLTLNLSRHQDLMAAMADANFWHVLIGIESFNEDSLKETNKLQNTRRDIVADCRKILAHGVGINGSLIVGFDHDGPDVFDRIIEGCRSACIPFASVSILRATHGTKLWARLREDKRLWKLRIADSLPQALQMDIMPGGSLSRLDLIEGRIYVNKELSKVANLCARLRGWIDLIERVPRVEERNPLTLDAAVHMIRAHRTLSLTEEERRSVEETLEYARDRVPVLIARVVDSILAQLYWYRIRTYHTDADLKRALEAEKAGDLVPDTKPILLPRAFATAFRKRLFFLVHERLLRSAIDPQLVPELASEVFVDFIVRFKDEGDHDGENAFLGPHYEEMLGQLCDRVVARVTGRSAEVAHDEGEESPRTDRKSLKRAALYDAVLKDVGDRLSRFN